MVLSPSQYENEESPRADMFSERTSSSRLTQYWNAALPILIRFSEKATEESASLCLNAIFPRALTVSGISMLASDMQ